MSKFIKLLNPQSGLKKKNERSSECIQMNTRNRITYNNDIDEQFDPKHKYSNTIQSKGEKKHQYLVKIIWKVQ